MAKLFDKISADFMAAIKGVVESTAAFEKSRDDEKKARMSGEEKDKVAKLAAMMSKEKKKMKEETETLDELSVGAMKKYRTAARADAMDADDVDDERRYRKRAAGSNTAGKKIVRKGGSLKEDEQIDELSTDTMRSYMDKASDARGHRKLPTKKVDNRYSGVQKASAKLAKEEAEELDEISKATMGRYINKAKDAIDMTSYRQGHRDSRTAFSGNTEAGKAAERKLSKRHKGIETAVKKLTKEDAEQIDEKQQYIEITNAHTNSKSYVPVHKTQAFAALNHYNSFSHNKRVRIIDKKEHDAIQRAKNPGNPSGMKEDAEQIDELSKGTMGRYINKAATKMGSQGVTAGLKIAADEKSSKQFKDMGKRERGIKLAVNKLTKEEIEMIEAKMAGVACGSMEGDKHMCATKVFHKEWNEGTPIKTMHAEPDADGLIEWYDVLFDHGIERVMTEDMEILQAESHMHSKKKMKEEAEELDEARGRPKKAAAKDYTVHPKTGEKLMHNNPAHMKKIELLQKNKVIDKPKTEAGQHVINQLEKAKTSMQGGSTIHFTHGESKHVSGTHAAKLIDKYRGMKPSEKEDFQKKISHSHEEMMKHV